MCLRCISGAALLLVRVSVSELITRVTSLYGSDTCNTGTDKSYLLTPVKHIAISITCDQKG